MTSSVFFKFKSSKEPRRIVFDGTGITVFELKREIIRVCGLGDGTNFDLAIYPENSNEEYEDDTVVIPRSTTVISRRIPAARPGHGKAARYVSGQTPTVAKSSYRLEGSSKSGGASSTMNKGIAEMLNLQSEEERIAAMFRAQGQMWEEQQEKMAKDKPVYRGNFKSKPVNVPDHDPPPGYICYRCHKKGHWIQVCPTNDDPSFDGRQKIKRTTGIPRSFLKTVERPAVLTEDGLTDSSKAPCNVMINADGEYVIAEPDKASWEQYQAKAKASAARQQAVEEVGSKELQERGLECPIDKRMFVDPMKTPCCGVTYCNDCIENALVNSDLTCPNCSKSGVLIDELTVDEEINDKIKKYEETKLAEQKNRQANKGNGWIDSNAASDERSKDGSGVDKLESVTETTVTFSGEVPAGSGSFVTNGASRSSTSRGGDKEDENVVELKKSGTDVDTATTSTLSGVTTTVSSSASTGTGTGGGSGEGEISNKESRKRCGDTLVSDREAPAISKKSTEEMNGNSGTTTTKKSNGIDQNFIDQMNSLAGSTLGFSGPGGMNMPGFYGVGGVPNIGNLMGIGPSLAGMEMNPMMRANINMGGMLVNDGCWNVMNGMGMNFSGHNSMNGVNSSNMDMVNGGRNYMFVGNPVNSHGTGSWHNMNGRNLTSMGSGNAMGYNMWNRGFATDNTSTSNGPGMMMDSSMNGRVSTVGNYRRIDMPIQSKNPNCNSHIVQISPAMTGNMENPNLVNGVGSTLASTYAVSCSDHLMAQSWQQRQHLQTNGIKSGIIKGNGNSVSGCVNVGIVNGQSPNFSMQGINNNVSVPSNKPWSFFNDSFTNNEEESAYFRQPVNPLRHQFRQRRIRPSDYTEL